ncbi:hypothetical protein U0035_01310 [Niabella yanshanensis]|uniref:Uncharacterized protein n=1 Tax=Niabella yanshanensis TaxID=577386 RepID=A0ABZ0W688_9BACT|nr:hypothetical protein [Niabella yanshanensis]WQD38780.1 hypothetical protein U0035_01310 [Niabella yanshanensis]
MKKVATQMALVACTLLLAGSASAQTDTTGRPVPDTVGRPIPDDTTRMPRDKKRSKKDRKMPKDSLNRVVKGNNSTAILNSRWTSISPTVYAITGEEFITSKEFSPKKEENREI